MRYHNSSTGSNSGVNNNSNTANNESLNRFSTNILKTNPVGLANNIDENEEKSKIGSNF
jgi:hypothetical protein